jgi:murein DD-endopeptidase MepM/ murein hydrolase activator NlpD
VGRRVRQQDTVGYVGATGLATGPHVCYRIKVDGRFIDPLRAELPNSKPISVRNLARFAPIRDARLSELSVVGPAAPLASRR